MTEHMTRFRDLMSDKKVPSHATVTEHTFKETKPFMADAPRVPPRFRREFERHLVAMACRARDSARKAPLLLVVTGPPGTGKSKMAEMCLEDLGAEFEILSGSALSGQFEGSSKVPIAEAYFRLGKRAPDAPLNAMIIDDFDLTSDGVDALRSGTVNGKLLSGLLMNLADNPWQIEKRYTGQDGMERSRNVDVEPVAIILTLNNASELHKPLVRDGRIRAFHWEPTQDELAEMLAPVVPSLDAAEVEELVGSFPGQSIAFFAQIPEMLADELLEEQLETADSNGILKNLALIDRIGSSLDRALDALTLEEAIAYGQALEARRGALGNFLTNVNTKMEE